MTSSVKNRPARPEVLGDRRVTVEALLTRVVVNTTGDPEAAPRPGQLLLAQDAAMAMATRGHIAGAAPTGCGKTYAGLVPAALRAAEMGERSVYSTQGLPLMDQILQKDGPAVAQATLELTGRPIIIAPLKGWANYVCAQKMSANARTLAGLSPDSGGTDAADFAALTKDRALTSAAAKVGIGSAETVDVDGVMVGKKELAALVLWAAGQVAKGGVGDRHSYTGDVSNAAWDAVSVSSAECVGVKECPFAAVCRPDAARELAANADIVITNHSLLGIQAAKGIPAVNGGVRLGTFRSLIVDEAHTLPSSVRDQGACVVSARRVSSVNRSMRRIFTGEVARLKAEGRDLLTAGERRSAEQADKEAARLEADAGALDVGGAALAEKLDGELTAAARHAGPGKVHRIEQTVDPLAQTGELLREWLARANKKLGGLPPAGYVAGQKRARLASKIATLTADVTAVSSGRSDTARWIETSPSTDGFPTCVEAKATPVDVAGMLIGNLYTAPVIPGEDGMPAVPEDQWCSLDEEGNGRYELSVCAISATLTNGFPREAGLAAKRVAYASPFDAAYSSSMLFIPRATAEADIERLDTGASYRPAFSNPNHQSWARDLTIELVAANRGSALVLSPTSAGGREYAAALRAAAAGRWHVHSQWDGPPSRVIVDRWREDVGAVLVGTKSLMTGVDAKGDTCSLVVIPRPARAAGNPVDDARVEHLKDKLTIDQRTAVRMVYVSDAALLLEQSAGRLIRGMSDRGLVAVLDPRLLRIGPFSYEKSDPKTRAVYMDALDKFPRSSMTADLDVAVEFLRGLTAGRTAA